MRNFEKFSKERYTPLYPFQKGIKGYNAFLLPVSFQDFTFEIQRALLRCFDWMKLPAFRQVNDNLIVLAALLHVRIDDILITDDAVA